MDITGTDPKRDWSYVAEGGASIVFSYVGPFHLLFNGKVLRLRKTSRLLSVQPPHSISGTDEEPDDPSIAFQNTVTSKLVPNTHLPDLQTVKASSQWLRRLADVAEPCRPVERAAKDGIDTSKARAVLATDLVGGQGWAVEIKVAIRDIQIHSFLSKHRQAEMGVSAVPHAPLALYAPIENTALQVLHAFASERQGFVGGRRLLPIGFVLWERCTRQKSFGETVGGVGRKPGQGEQFACIRRWQGCGPKRCEFQSMQ